MTALAETTPTNPLGVRAYIYTIVTPGLDASLDYYCRLMGYEQVGEGILKDPPRLPGLAAGRRYAFVRTMAPGLESGMLRLVEAPADARPARPRPRTSIMDPGFAVIECLSRNVDESYERMAANGVETITRPLFYSFGEMPALNGAKVEQGLEFRSYSAYGPAGEQMFISTCVTRDRIVPPPWPHPGLHNGFVAGVLVSLDRWPLWRFYDDALGIKPTRDTFSVECTPLIGAAPESYFQFGMMGEPTMMEWWEYRHRAPESQPPYPTGMDRTGLAMTTMVVNDLTAVRERVAAMGIPILADRAMPTPELESQPALVLRGGVGELVEVIQRAGESNMKANESIRVGVLVPQGNVVHAAEFDRLKPDDVVFKFLGFGYPPQTATDFCADLAFNMTAPAEALRDWGADVILVGCTTASMACAGSALIPQLEAAAGIPVVTAASAAREAIAALGVGALAVATPYGDRNNQIIIDFLTGSGVEVAAIAGLDLDRSVEAWLAGAPTLTPDRVFELSRSVAVDGAEGLYLPCTGMGSLDTIDRFEAEMGKPAFSSVQAGYWAALRRIGYDGRRQGVGRLLDTWDF